MKALITKTMLCVSFAALALTSCELDQNPVGSIREDEAWEKVTDADKFYIGLLSALRGVSGGSNVYVTEAQADLFNITLNASSLNQEHKWTFTTQQFAGDNIWASNYGLIGSANYILDNINRIPADEDEKEYLQTYVGVCHMARAYAYINMLPRYCVNYENEEQAATAYGLSIVENVDIKAKPARASLKETYEYIFNELDLAESLIYDEGTLDEPGLDLLTALRARACLLHKDYDKAIECCDVLIDAYPLIDNESNFSKMWSDDTGSEIIYQPSFSIYERGGSYNPVFISYSDKDKAYEPYFLPSQGLLDLYSARDYRKDVYFTQVTVQALTNRADRVWMFNKYPGNSQYLYQGETSGNILLVNCNQVKAVRVAEMYLIAAESCLFKAQPDEEKAKEYLNALRAARGLERKSDQITSTGAELVQDMKNEWVRELVGEGFRLDCLKRWGDPMQRMKEQQFKNVKLLNDEPGCLGFKAEANDMRFLWEIPTQELQANENIKDQRNWNVTF